MDSCYACEILKHGGVVTDDVCSCAECGRDIDSSDYLHTCKTGLSHPVCRRCNDKLTTTPGSKEKAK